MIVTARKQSEIVTRRGQALKLFFDGSTMRQIAEKLDCSLGTVSGDIQAELKNHADETRYALRMQKLEEYSALKVVWREKALGGDAPATALYLKILSQESKCLGVDAPASTGYSPLFYNPPFDPLGELSGSPWAT